MRIGIDIGGTKIALGIVDSEGRVSFRQKVTTDREKGYRYILTKIVNLIGETIKEAGLERKDIERIGVATAGQIDFTTQMIIFSPNLKWQNVSIKADIEQAIGIETFLENDVNAATYGEWRFAQNREPKDVVGIFIGTGIGGGLIIDKRLYRGSRGVGGEIGHIILNPYGYKCNCGARGCFEAYCGGRYMTERVKGGMRMGYKGKVYEIVNGKIEDIHAGHIEEAYLYGDELCRRIWLEVVEHLAAAMASIANLLNPDVIILGGGVIYGTKYLMEESIKAMKRWAMAPSLQGLRIKESILKEDAGIIGAAFVE
jgi:glucokinase